MNVNKLEVLWDAFSMCHLIPNVIGRVTLHRTEREETVAFICAVFKLFSPHFYPAAHSEAIFQSLHFYVLPCLHACSYRTLCSKYAFSSRNLDFVPIPQWLV